MLLCDIPSIEEGRRCCTCYHVAFLVQNRDQSAYRILWPHPRRTLPLFSLRDKKVRKTYAEASLTSSETSNTQYRALSGDRASLKATSYIYTLTSFDPMHLRLSYGGRSSHRYIYVLNGYPGWRTPLSFGLRHSTAQYKGYRRSCSKALYRLCRSFRRGHRHTVFASHVYKFLLKGNCLGENAGQSASKSSGESYALSAFRGVSSRASVIK